MEQDVLYHATSTHKSWVLNTEIPFSQLGRVDGTKQLLKRRLSEPCIRKPRARENPTSYSGKSVSSFGYLRLFTWSCGMMKVDIGIYKAAHRS